jgi:hypothetical protein
VPSQQQADSELNRKMGTWLLLIVLFALSVSVDSFHVGNMYITGRTTNTHTLQRYLRPIIFRDLTNRDKSNSIRNVIKTCMADKDDKEDEVLVNFKSPVDSSDPRESWKGDIAIANGPRFGAAKVPDAITQTDNSEKRLQNAQLRARQRAEANEPEALRQMRLAREREEAEEAAAAEARRRSDAKDFVSGQDVREQRLIDEHAAKQQQQQQQQQVADGAPEELPDIRLRVKAMQKGGGGGGGRRASVDREALLHQSQRTEQSAAAAAAAITAFANRALPEALGAAALALSPALAAEAARANAFMNGALVVPTGRLLELDASGMTIEAQVPPARPALPRRGTGGVPAPADAGIGARGRGGAGA